MHVKILLMIKFQVLTQLYIHRQIGILGPTRKKQGYQLMPHITASHSPSGAGPPISKKFHYAQWPSDRNKKV